MSKNESLNKTGPSEDENFVRSDNPGQTIWNKIDKSSKTREGKDKFRVYFCQSLFSARETCDYAMSPP